jgi:hypothetical protein
MGETGQSAHRVRSGLQTVASWMGLRRRDRRERSEDLLAEPVPDSVEFISLSPYINSHQSGTLMPLINDSWIRRHCDPVLYERAETLVNNSDVIMLTTDNERLTAKVHDGDMFSVEIRLEHGALSGLCQCDSFLRQREASTSVDQRLQCAHIAAFAHYLVSSGLMPQPGPGDRAALCPITRQTLDTDRTIYRCERCQLSYSEEGWQFLREMDHGRCCGCQARNSIHALNAEQADPDPKHGAIL